MSQDNPTPSQEEPLPKKKEGVFASLYFPDKTVRDKIKRAGLMRETTFNNVIYQVLKQLADQGVNKTSVPRTYEVKI